MGEYKITDALTGDAIIQDQTTGEMKIYHCGDPLSDAKSMFFPGCSMINYAMPLALAVYDTLVEQGVVDCISLLCCGKILMYEDNGNAIRAAFEDELRDHIAATSIERVICACPNCFLAMKNAFAKDERTRDIKIEALPRVMADIGYRIDESTIANIVKGDSEESVLLCPHDSCPDRDYGEFADGVRDILPSNCWVDPAHNRNKSVCCGSLPRAAGKIAAADKCADINGREAQEVSADAMVTACMSCAFQLNMAQSYMHAYHFLEFLYNWPIDWAHVGQWMKIRFLFNDVMGVTELDEVSARQYSLLGKRDRKANTDVGISNENAVEADL